MEKPPVLRNELARLEELYSYDILEMEREGRFDGLTKLAASILEVPICLITLMDSDWHSIISNVGTDMKGNKRELTFCKYCVVQEDILEVKDTTKDERFSQNPLVVDTPNLRYYVGSPLIDDEGLIIGTVCGYDLKPRQMTEFQKVALKQISSTVMRLIQLSKIDLERIDSKSELDRITKSKNRFISDMSHEIRTPLSSILGINELLLGTELSNEQQSHAETIKVAAKQLTEIVSEVFDAHRIAPNHNSIAKYTVPNKSSTLTIPSLNGLTIFLAEDNKHLQTLCKTFIERNDGEIYTVSNGQEAIDFLSQHEVDVVLLDMQMPKINGIQVSKYIREELKLNCPIIGCSANLLDVDHSPHELQYLDVFITKPYTEYQLITKVLHLFESKISFILKDDFKKILNDLRKKEGDELVNEFEKIFKNRIPQDIDDLIQARKTRNFDEIKRKAHFLTTTLLTLKFSRGLALSEELEQAVDSNQDASTLMLTDRFIDYLNGALTNI